MHILSSSFYFWVTTKIGLHALVLEKHISFFHTLQCCSTVFPLCLKHSVLAPEYPVSSDWSPHTCLTQNH